MNTKEMTIAVNGSMLDEKPSGVGVYSFNLINNLSNLFAAHSLQPLTVFSPTESSLNRNLHIIKLSSILQSSRYGKVAALSRFLWNTFIYPIQAARYDLLISTTTHGSFLLNNQIITIHDLLSLRYNNISRHQRLYFKYLLPFLVKKARLIIVVSETTKKDVIDFLNCPAEKIKVVYNGYDNTRFFMLKEKTTVIREEYGFENYLLAVGPTYAHKNFELLIAAYDRLKGPIKSALPLVIAGGKKDYIAKLKIYVRDLGLENNVHFIGYVPVHILPSLYREATALIFPSLYEGFGIPLLEAMACGCPVITSNTSSMPEVCGDAALYVDPLNKSEITDAIETVIENETVSLTLKEKGLRQCEKFSWKQAALSLKQIIDDLNQNRL